MAELKKIHSISHFLISGILISIFLIIALIIKNNSVLQVQSARHVLWSLITNSGLVVLILTSGLSLFLYFYKKNNRGRIRYLEGIKVSAALVFTTSFITGVFQIIYARAINTSYLEQLKAQEKQVMVNLGFEKETIETAISESYGSWSLFSNTFFYFFLIGLFVAILVTAYAYKRPLQ